MIKPHPKKQWYLELQRSEEDVRTNQFNPHMLQIWRANHDFQVITSLSAVFNYVAKYAAKSEGASKTLGALLTSFVEKEADDQPVKLVLRKLLLTYPIE